MPTHLTLHSRKEHSIQSVSRWTRLKNTSYRVKDLENKQWDVFFRPCPHNNKWLQMIIFCTHMGLKSRWFMKTFFQNKQLAYLTSSWRLRVRTTLSPYTVKTVVFLSTKQQINDHLVRKQTMKCHRSFSTVSWIIEIKNCICNIMKSIISCFINHSLHHLVVRV